jgi:hypothetical protein
MPISYDPVNKQFNIQYEKQDYPVLSKVSVTRKIPIWGQTNSPTGKGSMSVITGYIDKTATVDINGDEEAVRKAVEDAGIYDQLFFGSEASNAREALKTALRLARIDNNTNQAKNTEATNNNNLYRAIDGYSKVAEPGRYLQYKQTIDDSESDQSIKDSARTAFDLFYKDKVVSLWDASTGSKVPFEGFENTIRFDPTYYGSTTSGKGAKEAWDKAVKNGDLDILGRHPNYESYALWHYSNIGQNNAKKNGERDPGFKPLTPTDGFEYGKVEESVPGKTDAARQFERDKIATDILGLKQTTQGYQLRDLASQYRNLVTSNAQLKDQWSTAKSEILYADRFPKEPKQPWAKLYDAVKEATGAEPEIQTETGFGELLTKAYQLDSTKYPGAQQLIKDIQSNKEIGAVDTKLSEYDTALTKVASEAEIKQTEKAAIFQKQFLEDSRKALIDAKKAEQKFDLLSGTSFGQEILGMRENIANSILQESGVGGILSMGGQKKDDLAQKFNLSLDTGKVFGSNNGLLYNWEKWFFDEIEKKYAGGLDVPNDYVPGYQRNIDNGFVTEDQVKSWKQYDDAYDTLKKDPGNISAQQKVNATNLPKDYVPVEKRKTTKQEWLDYEAARRSKGWVDNDTLASWSDYDDAYNTLNNPNATEEEKQAAQAIYNKKPADYLDPSKRIDSDIQFAQDFFNDYLLPRFNASKSISEFRDYIDVDKDKQNIFQTEDRLQSLKNAAESASVSWMKALDSLGTSKFNSEYYFDPGKYYLEKGVGTEGKSPVLLGEQFQKEWGSTVPDQYIKQKTDIENDWEKAKAGQTTKDDNGNDINWQAKAYLYGFDLNNKEDFAKLHYELLGQARQYDSAPDVFNPRIAQIYLKQVLTPYLADKYAKIGTVFGQFVNPEEFADEFVNKLDPLKNKEQTEKVLKLYGLDPNTEDLSQLKQMISESIRSSDALDIRAQIKKLNQESETPTQELLGVEYIQRASDKREEAIKSDDALFNRFKSAGYQGTQEEFYSDFMPDATEEDKEIFKSMYSGKAPSDLYKFKPTGDPFADLGKLESMSSFGEEETTPEKKTPKPTEPKSKYFSFFPEEDTTEEEEEPSSPVKIKRGSDILAAFKSKLNLSPTAGKTDSTDLSDPFSNSFFGSF